ncbi:glycoside hydrolase family 13 protein [Flavihumibacter profundi]|uniref:glycoside hydrolase family 13 protein n=1 Tax=Flavihumibacter profundi TaxID=2716883 RepID=UPI001CC37035|nr:glycoside hydrolase family 13 protein [Flavihumibacter profundi]MBZ5856197.1 glycoside hydrolase family 13 protein [Flavihumibacter profundi]
MKQICSVLCAIFLLSQTFAQELSFYPTNWWVGMKNPKLQIMVHGKDVGKSTVSIAKYQGITLQKITKAENPNYIFLDLLISANTKPGKLAIQFKQGTKLVKSDYLLKVRQEGKGRTYAQGVTSSDLIYLLMPDRFSNGDPSNDRIPGLKDQSLNRDSIFNRHGGDIKGIINHLDYLQDLGATTVWMTPVLENDMPDRTEHGYAITDHYKVDPRLGTNEDYIALGNALHKRGMKLIQDAVYNHCGLYHFFVQDKPMKDWLHEWPTYTGTNYKDQALFDPYAAKTDKQKMVDGWFTPMMPDLNQNNPFVANFLIQNAIWSVETFRVDGWRIDTYIYNDLAFMNRCNKALLEEYPRISLFGETWVHGVPNQSFFCENTMKLSFNSNLPATTDFQLLFYGIQESLAKPFGWTDGVNKLYTTTAQDFLYKNPMREVIFLSNHDLPRFYSVLNEDTAKYKVALSWLLTFRGVPQLYYGDENLMTGFTNPDGRVRLDFKGGWVGDTVNKFTAGGRTQKENAIFNHIRNLAQFRKTSTAIKTGKMMQFAPEEGVYVYFRYDQLQTVMCIMNTNNTEKDIDLSRFRERLNKFKTASDIPTGKNFQLGKSLHLSPMNMLVLNLR